MPQSHGGLWKDAMPPASNGFTVSETHGGNRRAGAQAPPEIQLSSGGWAWPSLYASQQRESPFEDTFEAVDDQLLILHLDGPVTVHRRVRNGESSRHIPPGGLFMVPGGMDFGVRPGGSLLTLHQCTPLRLLGIADRGAANRPAPKRGEARRRPVRRAL
jgi:hypothetical protein